MVPLPMSPRVRVSQDPEPADGRRQRVILSLSKDPKRLNPAEPLW